MLIPGGLSAQSSGDKRVHTEPTGVTDRTLLLDQHDIGVDDVFYWPSIVPVHSIPAVEEPPGEYYLCYRGSHSDTSIRLAYADDPLGPYSDRGPIFEDSDAGPQTETPEVVWDPDAGRSHMYYHGFLGTN